MTGAGGGGDYWDRSSQSDKDQTYQSLLGLSVPKVLEGQMKEQKNATDGCLKAAFYFETYLFNGFCLD